MLRALTAGAVLLRTTGAKCQVLQHEGPMAGPFRDSEGSALVKTDIFQLQATSALCIAGSWGTSQQG
jgi:hypothetical protein